MSSSNNTDFIFHHIPDKTRLKVRSGFKCHRLLPKYIFIRNPAEQIMAEIRKKIRKWFMRLFVGRNPNTAKFFLSKSQIISQESASWTIIPIMLSFRFYYDTGITPTTPAIGKDPWFSGLPTRPMHWLKNGLLNWTTKPSGRQLVSVKLPADDEFWNLKLLFKEFPLHLHG